MKVTELFEANRQVNLRDPDHEPGAVDREAKARGNLQDRQVIAAANLTKISKKYKLGEPWKVGTNSSMFGSFVMPDRNGEKFKGKFKTARGQMPEAQLWIGGRYEDIILSLYDVDMTKDGKAAAKAKMQELGLDAFYTRIQSDDRSSFKSISFHFGEPSRFAEKKEFNALNKFIEYLKKEAEFS